MDDDLKGGKKRKADRLFRGKKDEKCEKACSNNKGGLGLVWRPRGRGTIYRKKKKKRVKR